MSKRDMLTQCGEIQGPKQAPQEPQTATKTCRKGGAFDAAPPTISYEARAFGGFPQERIIRLKKLLTQARI